MLICQDALKLHLLRSNVQSAKMWPAPHQQASWVCCISMLEVVQGLLAAAAPLPWTRVLACSSQ